jgi:hypothetical protein
LSDPFDDLLKRAKAIEKGDDAGLKALIADMLAASFSKERCDMLVRAAARASGFDFTVVGKLVNQTRLELREKEQNTPEAREAARIVREADRERIRQSCSKIAMSKTLLADMEDIVHRLGVVREGSAIRAIYLAAMSRLGARTICLLRRGASAGGKNYPITVALELFPEDSIVRLSSGSSLSLITLPAARTPGVSRSSTSRRPRSSPSATALKASSPTCCAP